MVYLMTWVILMLDSIKDAMNKMTALLFVGSLVCMIIFIVAYSLNIDEYSKKEKKDYWKGLMSKAVKYFRRAMYLSAFLFIVNSLAPSSRNTAIIVAAGQSYEVLTSESAKELSGETFSAIKRLLKQVGVEDAPETETVIETIEVEDGGFNISTLSEDIKSKVEQGEAFIYKVNETVFQIREVISPTK